MPDDDIKEPAAPHSEPATDHQPLAEPRPEEAATNSELELPSELPPHSELTTAPARLAEPRPEEAVTNSEATHTAELELPSELPPHSELTTDPARLAEPRPEEAVTNSEATHTPELELPSELPPHSELTTAPARLAEPRPEEAVTNSEATHTPELELHSELPSHSELTTAPPRLAEPRPEEAATNSEATHTAELELHSELPPHSELTTDPARPPSHAEPLAEPRPEEAVTNSEATHTPELELHSELPPEVYRADQPQYVPPTQALSTVAPQAPPPPPPPPKPPADEDDGETPEERGMLRMSFMEHLEDLRAVILRSIAGVLVAFFASFLLAKQIWDVVSAPAIHALREIGAKPPNLVAIAPLEQFNVVYLKLPLLMAVFLGSPWIFYQIWSFISPGLYKREKRWAVPFILATAGLFITGGLFAYFVAFRYGLVFLLGIGRDINISPMVSIDTYFDLFVNVTLGVGLVFEMPVIIFFLTLLRVASPRFLLKHSRYAILAITIIAAIVTPTPDAFNMTLFTIPMIALYFLGLFASYLLVLRREGKKFPWYIVGLVILGLLLVAAGIIALLIYHYHFHFIQKWPFLVK